MPFETVTQISQKTSRENFPVKLALYYKVKHAKGGMPGTTVGSIEIVVNEATCSQMGWVAGTSRIEVLEGTGPDVNLLQLRLSDKLGVGVALSYRDNIKKLAKGACVLAWQTLNITHSKLTASAYTKLSSKLSVQQ